MASGQRQGTAQSCCTFFRKFVSKMRVRIVSCWQMGDVVGCALGAYVGDAASWGVLTL
jgi:hypothetical protein